VDTVINGNGVSSVVTFSGSETSDCLLTGFTITGGFAAKGGGILGNGTRATIDRCIIEYNTAAEVGGGVQNYQGTISNCVLRHNSGGDRGGAMGACIGSIIQCLIHHNTADKGGALHWCNGDIVNCTITANTSNSHGVLHECHGRVFNSIVWGNSPAIVYNCTAGFEYNCLEWSDTGTGNINIAPDFVGMNDYHLLAHSVCIDVGANDLPGFLAPEDIEGNLRLIDGDNDQLAIIDMGVYEAPFNQSPVIQTSVRHFDLDYLTGAPFPPDQFFNIRNRGGDVLGWEIIENCDWLSVTPNSGTSTGENTQVNIALDPSHLDVGKYHYELIISDPNAINHPQKVTVEMYVHTKGQLHVPVEYETIQAAIDAARE
ncbi:MAG: hypothetical protein GY869_19730, partial [Planctomycetes bacterium]|nr:hypothetical protein [Planctomycetota bacterium]